jgi:hypothetical protein
MREKTQVNARKFWPLRSHESGHCLRRRVHRAHAALARHPLEAQAVTRAGKW